MSINPFMKRFYCSRCEIYFRDSYMVECPICDSKDYVSGVNVYGIAKEKTL